MKSIRTNVYRVAAFTLIASALAFAPLTAKASTDPEPPPPTNSASFGILLSIALSTLSLG
jgi:hypothetical protein